MTEGWIQSFIYLRKQPNFSLNFLIWSYFSKAPRIQEWRTISKLCSPDSIKNNPRANTGRSHKKARNCRQKQLLHTAVSKGMGCAAGLHARNQPKKPTSRSLNAAAAQQHSRGGSPRTARHPRRTRQPASRLASRPKMTEDCRSLAQVRARNGHGRTCWQRREKASQHGERRRQRRPRRALKERGEVPFKLRQTFELHGLS